MSGTFQPEFVTFLESVPTYQLYRIPFIIGGDGDGIAVVVVVVVVNIQSVVTLLANFVPLLSLKTIHHVSFIVPTP